MIKAGDLVRFRCGAGRVYLVLQVEPPVKRNRHPHLRLAGPTIAGVPIENLRYPVYRFEVISESR